MEAEADRWGRAKGHALSGKWWCREDSELPVWETVEWKQMKTKKQKISEREDTEYTFTFF